MTGVSPEAFDGASRRHIASQVPFEKRMPGNGHPCGKGRYDGVGVAGKGSFGILWRFFRSRPPLGKIAGTSQKLGLNLELIEKASISAPKYGDSLNH